MTCSREYAVVAVGGLWTAFALKGHRVFFEMWGSGIPTHSSAFERMLLC